MRPGQSWPVPRTAKAPPTFAPAGNANDCPKLAEGVKTTITLLRLMPSRMLAPCLVPVRTLFILFFWSTTLAAGLHRLAVRQRDLCAGASPRYLVVGGRQLRGSCRDRLRENDDVGILGSTNRSGYESEHCGTINKMPPRTLRLIDSTGKPFLAVPLDRYRY
jgi:hypothetical protein